MENIVQNIVLVILSVSVLGLLVYIGSLKEDIEKGVERVDDKTSTAIYEIGYYGGEILSWMSGSRAKPSGIKGRLSLLEKYLDVKYVDSRTEKLPRYEKIVSNKKKSK